MFHPLPFVIKSYWEMVTYGLMGATLGLLAASYIRFFHFTGAYFRRMQLPQWVKLMAGLAAVGAIAIVLPLNLSDGYPVIDQALAGKLTLGVLASLMTAKFVASAISLDCGAPGGVFGPTFFIGAVAGGSFRDLCNLVVPGLTGPRGSYALVALGAFLGGVTHAPLTAIFLLFEMTQLNYEIAMPAMIATITSLVVAHALERESIDTYSLAREGKTLAIGQERLVLTQLPVASVMTKEVDIVSANAALADVLRVAGDTAQATLPVVDSDGQLAALIVIRDLLALLAGGTELGPLVNAYDLGRRNPPVITPESNLDEAAQLMEYEALDEVPVVERPNGGRFIGMVTHKGIAQAFNRVAVSLSTLGTRDNGIFWATGYRVSRLQSPKPRPATRCASSTRGQIRRHRPRRAQPRRPDHRLRTDRAGPCAQAGDDLIVVAGRWLTSASSSVRWRSYPHPARSLADARPHRPLPGPGEVLNRSHLALQLRRAGEGGTNRHWRSARRCRRLRPVRVSPPPRSFLFWSAVFCPLITSTARRAGPEPGQQLIEPRPEARLAKRMRGIAMPPSPSNTSITLSTRSMRCPRSTGSSRRRHAEQQQVAEVGIGFDTLENRTLKPGIDCRIDPVDLSIDWVEAMLREADGGKRRRIARHLRVRLRSTLESDDSLV